MIDIAVDMMGSDHGPEVLGEAVKNYLKDHKDISFTCFGEISKLEEIFKGVERVKIVDAPFVLPMETKPLDFLRHKDSSMYKAIESVRNGETQGVVSAGSTGGFISGSTILLRNIEGIQRSGLCAAFPTARSDKAAVILDVGANNVVTSDDLVTFARMGRIYAVEVLGVKEPKVYTLSNGAEKGKGTEEVVKAYETLEETSFPGFCGNVEARYVLDGEHDVIVASGFPGNVLLKATEGVASMMNQMIKKAFKKNILTMIGYLFAKSGFKKMRKDMDYKKYGGAILLGVDGVAVKGHGNSDAYAFYNAIDVSRRMIESEIVKKLGGSR